MKLFVYHTPELLPQKSLPQCAVAIDVLRATTTIATALNSGAEAIQVFSDIDELFAVSEAFPEEKRLRAGERGGRKVPNCDLGNSPLDCTPERVEGKRLFLSTTNGTRCLEGIQKSSTVIVAALVNRQAVVDYLLRKKPGKVWLVGSGWQGDYSLEDTICAGAIADGILEQSRISLSKLAGNDELIAAVALYRQWKDQLQELMALSSHGQRLLRLRGQKDIAYCCDLDLIDILPIQKEKGILVARQPGFFEKLFFGGLFGSGKKKPKQKQLKNAAVKDEVVKDAPKALPATKAPVKEKKVTQRQKSEPVAKGNGQLTASQASTSAQPKAAAKPKAIKSADLRPKSAEKPKPVETVAEAKPIQVEPTQMEPVKSVAAAELIPVEPVRAEVVTSDAVKTTGEIEPVLAPQENGSEAPVQTPIAPAGEQPSTSDGEDEAVKAVESTAPQNGRESPSETSIKVEATVVGPPDQTQAEPENSESFQPPTVNDFKNILGRLRQ
ncbi:MAG: 2-phosphosulfolactate phosphatase family protein [Thermosynechococcaceae cyanobacterium]